MLVQRGTLQVGDIVVAGAAWGRVRALINDHGEQVDEAGPSVPVEVLGFDGAPEAGDQFAVVENEARAREITDYRAAQAARNARRRRRQRGSLEQMMSQLKSAGRKEFPLVIKGDVQGSVEAIVGALEKLGTDEVAARIIHSGVGGITESDVTLAEAVGRRDHRLQRARQHAGARGRRARRRRDPLLQHHLRSRRRREAGDVRPAGADAARDHSSATPRSWRSSTSPRSARSPAAASPKARSSAAPAVRLIRDNVVIHEGKLSTLKRFKDEVREVPAGQECGMAFENYQDMRDGDVIECFRVEARAALALIRS